MGADTRDNRDNRDNRDTRDTRDTQDNQDNQNKQNNQDNQDRSQSRLRPFQHGKRSHQRDGGLRSRHFRFRIVAAFGYADHNPLFE